DQFYVGVADGRVAIYRGIPQEAFGLELSRLDERTSYALEEDLTEPFRHQVEGNDTRNVTKEGAWEWIRQAVERSACDRGAGAPACPSAPNGPGG
ncbi:MAG: hypothetical protein LBD90_03595, partial [Bifidobacteriaceae bacterium]|nr:hypothetical protein [Bifidobacteriaceae bacterium]